MIETKLINAGLPPQGLLISKDKTVYFYYSADGHIIEISQEGEILVLKYDDNPIALMPVSEVAVICDIAKQALNLNKRGIYDADTHNVNGVPERAGKEVHF